MRLLDLLPKTVLPKTPQPKLGAILDSKDIKEIKAVIDLMKKHDLSVFEIEKEGFRLKLQRGAFSSESTIVAPGQTAVPSKPAASGIEPPPAAKSIETVPLKEIVSP